MTVWRILSKVRIEAFCWGAGTALGELPPYFMARAHRLSGYDSDEEDDEFDELQEKLKEHPEDLVKQKNNYFNFSYYFSLSLSLSLTILKKW